MFVDPLTVVANACVWPAPRLTVVGFIETVTVVVGFSVIVACPDLVVSAVDVALTVTLCVLVTEPGAVYTPELEIEPTAGLSDHDTAVFVVPLTVALNVWVCEAVKLAVPGVTETPMETRAALADTSVTEACADFVGSATEVALTVSDCSAPIDAGAVYNPVLEMLPIVGVMDQVTAVLFVHATEAVNCCV